MIKQHTDIPRLKKSYKIVGQLNSERIAIQNILLNSAGYNWHSFGYINQDLRS